MEEIDLIELIKLFFRKKFLIIIVVLIFAILGFGYTKLCITPLYEATTSLIVVQTELESEEDSILYSKLIDKYWVIASSRNVASKVKENLKLNISETEIQGLLTVTGAPASDCLMITVSDSDCENAAKIANETAKVVIEEIDRIYQNKNVQILDSAIANPTPININLTKNVIKFSIVGLVLVCGYILVCFIKKILHEKCLFLLENYCSIM